MAVRVGIVLMVVSFALWALLPIVPVVGLRGGAAVGAVVALLVAAEVVFWLGLVLVGRDTWQIARRHGWRRVPGALWRLFRHPADARAGAAPPKT